MLKFNISEYFGNQRATQWNWKENFVQPDENFAMGMNFVSGKSTLLAAGPATAMVGIETMVNPIGLTPQIQMQQQLPQQRIGEIGSQRTHFVPGTPIGGGTIQRLIYNGPSLMRALYSATYDEHGKITSQGLEGQLGANKGTASAELAQVLKTITSPGSESKVSEGHNNSSLWLSLFDERFGASFGMAVFMEDNGGRPIGGVYLEGMVIQSHNWGITAGSNVIMEGVSFQFERSMPIKGVGISTISGSTQ